MSQFTIMRRANGELFLLLVKGRKHLAVWPSLESALRYKKRNPALLVFIPAAVASPFGRKSLFPLRDENLGLYLLIDAGGAHFSDGHQITWEEIEPSLANLSTKGVLLPSHEGKLARVSRNTPDRLSGA